MPMPDGTARGITLTNHKGRNMSALARRCRAKFDKLAALNGAQDIGGHIGMAARRTKSNMNDSWVKRTSSNVAGFYDASKARAIKRGSV